VVWITGRPASGKSSLARALADEFAARFIRAAVVDSDEVRSVITPEPRYTAEERALVYRAVAYLAARLAHEGIVAIVAATSHAAEYRRRAREICPRFFLVYARCPLEVCQARDPKGLYQSARADEQSTLPGVGVRYEEPADADRVVDTAAPVTTAQVREILDAFLSDVPPALTSPFAPGPGPPAGATPPSPPTAGKEGLVAQP
jgi:adenylylsulfate kinase